jgi:NAD(P)-dependent dehydrogenase (short-subunit alcohol dehydrogenase family)
VTETWAGAGILINGVAPGLVNTDFIHKMQADPVVAERLKQAPRALKHLCEPEEIAHLIAFLASPENTNLVAQIIFSDGGGDAILRPDHL